jgi:hypothetical protein
MIQLLKMLGVMKVSNFFWFAASDLLCLLSSMFIYIFMHIFGRQRCQSYKKSVIRHLYGAGQHR